MILGNGNPSLYSAFGRRSVPPAEPPESIPPPGRSEKVDQWIGEHPGVCVALALSFGVAIGWLLKRR
jgi:hypothetical protein